MTTTSGGRLSPNGRWLAYFSDETKRSEVYGPDIPDPQRQNGS